MKCKQMTAGILVALTGAALPALAAVETAAPVSCGYDVKPMRVIGGGFQTPESIEYYAAGDSYLVANINGSPLEQDGNGFISVVSPEGEVLSLKWLDGASEAVTLDAPKGMAVVGDLLFVADIDEMRVFELPSGKQLPSVAIVGSTFLNGVTPAGDGAVYVTDMGVGAGFKPTGGDAIYKVTENGYETVIKSTDLGMPNGVLAIDSGIYSVTFGSGAMQRLSADGKLMAVPQPPAGRLDGLVALADGKMALSSWNASSVYAVNREGEYCLIADGLEAPADMGYDSKRNRVLVPLFKKNELVILGL
jgi:hypothetical protein